MSNTENPDKSEDQTAAQSKKKKRYKFENLTPEALSLLYSIAMLQQDYDLKDLFQDYIKEQAV